MKLKVILAGCFLFFSFNTFAQVTIEFLGFGHMPADQLCVVDTAVERAVYVKSVYQAVHKELADGEERASKNCMAISNGRYSTDEIKSICEIDEENTSVGFLYVGALEYSDSELAVFEQLNSCEL